MSTHYTGQHRHLYGQTQDRPHVTAGQHDPRLMPPQPPVPPHGYPPTSHQGGFYNPYAPHAGAFTGPQLPNYGYTDPSPSPRFIPTSPSTPPTPTSHMPTNQPPPFTRVSQPSPRATVPVDDEPTLVASSYPLCIRASLVHTDILIIGGLAQVSVGTPEEEKPLNERRYIPHEFITLYSRQAQASIITAPYRLDRLDVSEATGSYDAVYKFSNFTPDLAIMSLNFQARKMFHQTMPGVFISRGVLRDFIVWIRKEALRLHGEETGDEDMGELHLPLDFCKTRDGVYNIIIDEVDPETSKFRKKFIPFANSETEHLMLWQCVLRHEANEAIGSPW